MDIAVISRNTIPLYFFRLLAGFALLHGEAALGQAWLDDQSLNELPSMAGSLALPTVPSDQGLFEPPPPLPEMPPSVFDEPIDEPVASGPIWYYPWTWIPLDGWSNSAELGLNGSAGNAESMSFQTGARLERKTDFSKLNLRLTHNQTNANGIETQNNTLFFGDFERFLGESRWNLFLKQGLEYDEFKNFDLRYFLNSGLGYAVIKSDDLNWTVRFGAGASREFGSPDNRWVPEALFGTDYEHQLNKRHKVIAKIDYYPEWGDFDNFRLISDIAWEYLLDEEGNLSLKLGANDRYDSTPNGAKPNDVNYSALLLYKF